MQLSSRRLLLALALCIGALWRFASAPAAPTMATPDSGTRLPKRPAAAPPDSDKPTRKWLSKAPLPGSGLLCNDQVCTGCTQCSPNVLEETGEVSRDRVSCFGCDNDPVLRGDASGAWVQEPTGEWTFSCTTLAKLGGATASRFPALARLPESLLEGCRQLVGFVATETACPVRPYNDAIRQPIRSLCSVATSPSSHKLSHSDHFIFLCTFYMTCNFSIIKTICAEDVTWNDSRNSSRNIIVEVRQFMAAQASNATHRTFLWSEARYREGREHRTAFERVERVLASELTATAFRTRFFDRGRPVVVEGGMESMRSFVGPPPRP